MARKASAADAERAADRRRDIEACLAALKAGPRSLPPDGRRGPDEGQSELVRAALEQLGPIFASFGLYLSGRLDLLPRRECLELARIPDRGEPSAAAAVADLVRLDLGGRGIERFHTFTATPFDSGLLTQQHHASIAPGVPVVVRIVHPGIGELIERDLLLLPLIAPHLGISAAQVEVAVADFADTMARTLDQAAQADAYLRLAADAQGFAAPVCYRDYCGPRVLTLERIDGPTLRETALEPAIVDGVAPVDREALARQLWNTFLQHALESRVVPCSFGPRDLIVRGGRLVYLGTEFATQTGDGRIHFMSYVNAAAADDPDAACGWIIEHADPLRPGAADAAQDELRRRFRQAVPFRDGESSGDESLAEELLVHWRVAADAGWRVRPPFAQLYRAMFSLTRCTGPLAPGRDLLLLALQDTRLRLAMNDARQLVNPDGLTATLQQVVAGMVGLPQKLDEVLTLATEGRLRLKLHLPGVDDQRRVRNNTVALIAGLAAVASLTFVFRILVPDPGVTVERLGALALVVAGAWLLKQASTL